MNENSPRWEYHVIQLKTDFTFWSGTEFNAGALVTELNRLGAQGWELVAVFDIDKVKGGSKFVNAVLKRPKA